MIHLHMISDIFGILKESASNTDEYKKHMISENTIRTPLI